MWKAAFDAFLKLFDLTRNVEHQAKRIAVLEQKNAELHEAFGLHTLAYQKDRELWETERQLLLSQVEILLLKQKHKKRKRLPPAATPEVGHTQVKALPPTRNLEDEDDQTPTES